MDLPFKHTVKFYQEISVANLNDSNFISSASLDSLHELAPKGIDFNKNIDLIGVAFNAAVANKFNKNGDGIDTATAIAIKDYFVHKPTNIEHQKQKIVGHIVGASLSSYKENDIISEEDAASMDGPFNIALSAVIYKTVNPEFAKLVENSADESSEHHHQVSASWEIGFNEYAIALGGEDLRESRIITDETKEEYIQYLKAYGGNGRTEEGVAVNRLIMGEIYPIGIGFTSNPAADVKGLITLDKDFINKDEDDEKAISFDKIKIKNNIFEEKNSHFTKDDVIFSKNQKPTTIMEKEILEQITETLEAQASSKKLSEEAIANITKVFHDAIMQKNEQWQQDKENLIQEKEDLLKASAESEKEIESLKQELTSVNEKISELESESIAREEAERFSERMGELDEVFELEDEDRMILASELKSISSDESYAEYKEKLSVVWKHKTKAFKEEQEKLIAEKIEAEVQKRLQAISSKETQSEVTEEQAEEVIENIQAEEVEISNNDAASAQEELSLREKFKQAFTKESVNIKY